MEEKKDDELEYRFRGLGVLALCALLVAVGLWRFGKDTSSASSPVQTKQVTFSLTEEWMEEHPTQVQALEEAGLLEK